MTGESSQLTSEPKWAELSWEQKRERRFERWLSAPGIKFSNPDAQKAFRARLTRIIDSIKLKEPDRVPCILPAGQFPAYHAGITLRTAMYDYAEMTRAWRKFLYEFDGDTCISPAVTVSSGRVNEIIRNKVAKWPGHGLPEDAGMSQFVEGEYMKGDEYDALLKDPADFILRVYIPRTLGAFEPFSKLTPFKYTIGFPTGFLSACALPEVQEAFQAVIDAGKELAKHRQAVMEITLEAQGMGFPALLGGGAHAPFDLMGDTLRGTRGIITDMYRRPDKLHEAMETVTPWIIEGGVSAANMSGGPIVFLALHKGDDAFMSDSQFETFYWPYLKRVVMGLVNEGCVPLLFAEGSYNRRLEAINDLPKGSAVWWFDRTDMARAKKILGDNACISGNVPTSLLCTGTPEGVKECCRNLIEVCGKGGGYILNGGASVHNTTAANLRAMMDAVREYGVYR